MICHCCFLKRMRQSIENKENPVRSVSLASDRECTKANKGIPLDLLLLVLKENTTMCREQKDPPDTYTSMLG